MEHMSAGDLPTGVQHLRELIALTHETAEPYIPAYLQAGQALARLGEEKEACEILKNGIASAKRVGDHHARGEMEGLLSTLE
jgi:hypothetical protein